MNKVSYNHAVDLMIEDLHQKHHTIRILAKKLNCEIELDDIKDLLIHQLSSMRTELI
jgi:hypothetical protein